MFGSTTLFAAAAALGALPMMAYAQADVSSANNVTSLMGTWSSGSGAVQTGMGFANPVNYSFTYPNTTGISYSFTDDGFFEEAQYRFTSNASLPNCITAVVFFQHGTYDLATNGSIILNPFAADGRIQVQDPCAANTNVITLYDQITLYSDWGIQIDTINNNYALSLAKFDGSPMPPLYLVARPPNMLPTTTLTGYVGNTTTRKRSLEEDSVEKRDSSDASSLTSLRSMATAALGVVGLVGAGFAL